MFSFGDSSYVRRRERAKESACENDSWLHAIQRAWRAWHIIQKNLKAAKLGHEEDDMRGLWKVVRLRM